MVSITRRITKLERTPLTPSMRVTLLSRNSCVVIHVGQHDLEQIVGFLACDQIAGLHLGARAHLLLEVGEALGRVAVHGDLNDRSERQADLAAIHQRDAPRDHVLILERLHTARAGRRREPDALGQLEVRQRPIDLQRLQDAPIDLVEDGIGYGPVHDAIDYLTNWYNYAMIHRFDRNVAPLCTPIARVFGLTWRL